MKEKILSDAIYAQELTAVEDYVLRRQAERDTASDPSAKA